MARSHARVKVSIWRDADWLELSPEAKLTYVTLMSAPRLTIAGVMELAERRWERMTGYDAAVLNAALVELEQARYIIVDGATDELLIRTLTRHDLDPGRLNRNLAKGFWGAWGIVDSPILRSAIVHELDERLWEGLAEHAPDDATETRRSARLEPQHHYTVATVEPVEDEPRSQPPLSSLLSPSTSSQPADPSERRRGQLEGAAAVIGERAAARTGVDDPEAVRSAVAAGVVRNRWSDAYAILAKEPDLDHDELAERLEPTRPTRQALEPTRPAMRNVRDFLSYEVVDREETAAHIAAVRASVPFVQQSKELA